MLLAVEGGGFFSSSATGYSKGLTLLILGHRQEERPKRVSPWSHHHLHVASKRKQSPRGCGSFTCFGGASSSDAAGSGKKTTLSSEKGDEVGNGNGDAGDEGGRKVCQKSSLKKAAAEGSAGAGTVVDGGHEGLEERKIDERRKVHWTDACGRELAEIREFEASEIASDEESEHNGNRRCLCVIQ